MDTIDQPGRVGDDKAAFQHHENSDSEHTSHQEKSGLGSEEAMHESERDIPVWIAYGISENILTAIR